MRLVSACKSFMTYSDYDMVMVRHVEQDLEMGEISFQLCNTKNAKVSLSIAIMWLIPTTGFRLALYCVWALHLFYMLQNSPDV